MLHAGTAFSIDVVHRLLGRMQASVAYDSSTAAASASLSAKRLAKRRRNCSQGEPRRSQFACRLGSSRSMAQQCKFSLASCRALPISTFSGPSESQRTACRALLVDSSPTLRAAMATYLASPTGMLGSGRHDLSPLLASPAQQPWAQLLTSPAPAAHERLLSFDVLTSPCTLVGGIFSKGGAPVACSSTGPTFDVDIHGRHPSLWQSIPSVMH